MSKWNPQNVVHASLVAYLSSLVLLWLVEFLKEPCFSDPQLSKMVEVFPGVFMLRKKWIFMNSVFFWFFYNVQQYW